MLLPYEYRCPQGHTFTVRWEHHAQKPERALCPDHGAEASRVWGGRGLTTTTPGFYAHGGEA